MGSLQDRRYRFNLSSSEAVLTRLFRGVVYSGPRANYISNGDRVYGGAGSDGLQGVQVYGGPGDDNLGSTPSSTGTPILRGGPGNDFLASPGWLYGGPGADKLDDELYGAQSSDMLVGGPGRDTVRLQRDRTNDVVRVRGGGVDRIKCERFLPPDPGDVLFVDRSDRVSPGCKTATVLYTERPRYPYP